MLLQLTPTARIVGTAVWPVCAVVVGLPAMESSVLDGLAVSALLGPPAAFLAWRSYRMSVEVVSGKVVVRGLLWSRTIPRTSVRMLTGFPALCWRDASGRNRWTPLTVLMDPHRASRRQRALVQAQLRSLRKALGVKLY